MSNFNPSLEETIYVDFITSSPTTGAATDADSLPTCAVYEETNDTALVTPTVVKRTSLTGNYRVPVVCTAANGFEAAKSYSVVISATVGAVAAKAIAANFQMRTNDVDDVKSDTAAVKTKTDNLPSDPADASDIATSFTTVNTKLDTIDDFLDLEVAAIKAKTDSLTFTVAGQVDSNVQRINDVTITGDGQVGTEFGV